MCSFFRMLALYSLILGSQKPTLDVNVLYNSILQYIFKISVAAYLAGILDKRLNVVIPMYN